jgi:hypothetical protein
MKPFKMQCYKIPYIDATEIEFPTRFDYILICDISGNEVIRNFLKAEGKKLEYTSCFHGDKCKDIPLTIIMEFLYQSIMWIRHDTYIEKRLFSHRHFPAQRLEREIHFINSILELCEGKINMENFINILEQYKNNTDDFLFLSAFDILDKYTWQFELTDIRKEKIELIKNSLDEIINLLKHKSKWKEIYKVGYRIHNEPYFIYKNTNKY